MKRMNSKYAGKCGDCGERFAAGTLIDYDRHAPKGLKAFHADCSAPAAGAADAPEANFGGESGHGFKYFDGDARPFVMTRRGWRTGYEHTGRRCEDAPCCGCC